MKTINVGKLTYDKPSGDGTINLVESSGRNATLNIDLETLLPFANLVSKEVFDFFTISASVYGIDRFVERKQNSVDGWSRELKVSFPVHDPSKWNYCKKELNSLLSFLTGDYWDVSFRKEVFDMPQVALTNEYSIQFAQVNLLSGGLDSLIGALDFLKQKPNEKVLFVSHYDPQMRGVLKDQGKVIPSLEKEYPNQFGYIPSIRIMLEKDSRVAREKTFRSRSILFVGLALIAAEATKTKSIMVPENGTVSLNFPLSVSRRSSCSTRTTHPYVLESIITLWSKLSIATRISNPYEFKTKGEMVVECFKNNTTHLGLIENSNSCGKRGHVKDWTNRGATHCGVCMPCIYRQAALLTLKDKTDYGDLINNLFPGKEKRDKSQDSGAMLDFLNNPITKEEIKQELIVGGVKNLVKLNQFVEVVWRTRKELEQWVKKVGNSAIKLKAGV
ncbi:MAG: Qat anti-phage system QueC-like protein QatC [Dyadobacter sp.]|uniref:Qat anti-phage system QueC-like protein QatC n=1 Tax=Dyadobacter sp. TaxID=1914288 RepID=UPI0032652168